MSKNMVKKAAALLTAAAVALTGCGAPKETGEEGGSGQALGRYVEHSAELQTEFRNVGDFRRLSDGRLAVMSLSIGPYVSSDEGQTWQPLMQTAWEEIGFDNYNRVGAVAPDGSVFIQYSVYDETEDANTEEEEWSEESFIKDMYYAFLSPDGTVSKFPVTDIDDVFSYCAFAPDGRLYAGNGSNVYEVDREDGSFRQLFATEGEGDFLKIAGQKLFVFGTWGVQIYDLEKKEFEDTDEVLNTFVKSRAEGRTTLVYTGGNAVVMADITEDGSMYLACADGVYRHVLGGGTMELIIDGNLNSLGDLSASKYGMLVRDKEFLVLYGTALASYVYDPAIPAVPDRTLRVYGLRKDDCVRQAISLFQKEHQDVYVEYTEGLDENSGQTAEDAVKSLNTEILAGKGPDVILLDGLPLSSYMEKGMLKDLTALTDSLREECFDGMLRSFQKDEKVYAVPVKVRIPIMIGEEALLGEGSSLQDLTAAAVSLRGRKPEGTVIQTCRPEETLRMLSLASAPAWTDGEGNIREEKIREFLTEALAVYTAEKQGVTEEDIRELEENNFGSAGRRLDDAYLNAAANVLNTFMKEDVMSLGTVGAFQFGITNVVSVVRGKPGMIWKPMAGQAQQVYLPTLIAGISAKAAEPELAEEFLRMLLSKQNQDHLHDEFPVNRASLETLLTEPEGSDGTMGSMGLVYEDGTYVTLDCYYPNEEEKRQLTEILEDVRVPYLPDGVVEEAVIASGIKVLNGEIDVETGMRQILQAVQLYLAE